MQDQKQQLVDRLKQAQNILVTVSSNPSVDQLAAAIGLTLVLNHMDKHATAVYSGATPSTLEFLKPEDTLEKNTDSLRDFIIALDKSKADKLRYKVEDQVVRIFITPYKTSISERDLDFSQGDFNVDVVVALGVREQQDLDTAITAHGRILHDATVTGISTEDGSNIGSINWINGGASSLCEMVVDLANELDKQSLDSQVSTALLTGIVASTERFRNDKTTPQAMSASAALMANGANQQLIATQLEQAVEVSHEDEPQEESQPTAETSSQEPEAKREPGTLEIEHEAGKEPAADPEHEAESEPKPEEQAVPEPQVHVDANGHLVTEGEEHDESLPGISRVRGVGTDGDATESEPKESRDRIIEPPARSGTLTANSRPEALDPATEALTLPALDTPVLSHDEPALTPPQHLDESLPYAPPEPPTVPSQPAEPLLTHNEDVLPPAQSPTHPEPPTIHDDETITEIEKSVASPHLQSGNEPPSSDSASSVDSARDAVEAALKGSDAADPLKPIQALNAQPLGGELHEPAALPSPSFQPPAPLNTGFSESTPGNTPADDTLDMPLPTNRFGSQPKGSSGPFQPPNDSSLFTPPSNFPGDQPDEDQPSGDPKAPPVPPPFVPPPPPLQ